jgi:hypothetical protein
MSRLEHPLSSEDLMAYADGEIQGSEAAQVAEHLEVCSECAAAIADVKQLSSQMASWQVEDCPEKVAQGVLADSAERSTTNRRSWWSRPAVYAYGFGGLGVLFLFFVIVTPSLLRSRQAAQYAMSMPPAAMETAPPAAVPRRQGQQGQQGQPGPSGPMVIRNVKLSLVTNEFDAARTRIEAIVRQSQGYVDRLMVQGTGSTHALTATLRLPANTADAGIRDLKTIGRLVVESQNSSDITSQYVDLGARLSNAVNSEQRLLALLRERAGSLKDVVEMEREIEGVRENIERMEAQQKDLNNKVQFVTVDLELTEQSHAELAPPAPSTGTQIRNAAIEGIQSGGENVMGITLFLLRYGPALLIWLAVLFPVFLMLKRLAHLELRRRT